MRIFSHLCVIQRGKQEKIRRKFKEIIKISEKKRTLSLCDFFLIFFSLKIKFRKKFFSEFHFSMLFPYLEGCSCSIFRFRLWISPVAQSIRRSYAEMAESFYVRRERKRKNEYFSKKKIQKIQESIFSSSSLKFPFLNFL